MNVIVQKKRSMLPFVSIPLILLVTLTAFFLGRRSAPPGPATPAPAVSEAGHSEAEEGHAEGEEGHKEGESEGGHAEEGEGHEEGVVKFDEKTIKNANLGVERVSFAPLRSRLPVTGAIEPNLSGVVKVTPRVAGKVTNVRVNVGDSVRQGQSLAELASTELGAAQSNYRQAISRTSAARANLARQRELAASGEFGQHKVQEARGASATAQGEVNEALAEVNAARNGLAEAQAARAAAVSDVETARGETQTARAGVEQARVQIEVTKSRFDRQAALLERELTSKQDWEQARADYEKSRSDLNAAQAGVRAAEGKVQAAIAKVRQADAAINTSRARQRQASARLGASRQRLEIARQALAREERVFRRGLYASKEVAEAEATVRQAQMEVRAASDQVRLLGGSPGGGSTLAVTAPISGRVTERTVTLGETVTTEKTLFTVLNLNSVWAQLSVYSTDIASVRTGQAVSLTSDSAPGRTFTGSVSYIGDVVDETTRTVKVRAVVQNAGGVLRPGSFVRGRIAANVKTTTQALAVPDDAVQELEGKKVVFVQGDGPLEFHAKEVQAGDSVGGRTLIASGLKPGDRVVTKNAFTVKAQAMKAELGEGHAH